MRFEQVPNRAHEERPLRAGGSTGSVLIAFQARLGIDVDTVMAEVEELLCRVLDDWFKERGHELVEAVPEVA